MSEDEKVSTIKRKYQEEAEEIIISETNLITLFKAFGYSEEEVKKYINENLVWLDEEKV